MTFLTIILSTEDCVTLKILFVDLLFIHSTYKIQCPLTICIGVTEDGERFCVTKVINEHNHAIDKEIIERLPKVRKLNEDQEKDVKQMLKIHGNKWLIHEHVQNETGDIY
nr:uncharacterized protein LOC124816964 [Hydra vulgaris]